MLDDIQSYVRNMELTDEALAELLELIYKACYEIDSSPEEVEQLRLELSDEKRTYAQRIMYQK